ncbi:origin of replication complex subunit 5-like [Aristolochia californica]|uniref:origin of replication complex subunit 5-like n=1 Tax=Aristolochia californica TaxID=171875 RepID=UPI0035E050D0
MGKEEEIPQTSRRTTRSSCATPLKGTNVIQNKTDSVRPPSILSDLLAEEPISLDNLLDRFPGRRDQIFEILHLIGPRDSPMIPLLLYGGASTGKTSVILQVFRYLNRPFVYSSCRSCYCPRILFESVLDQLLLHRRKENNGYSSAKKCERFSDFVNFLRDALIQAIHNLKESQKETVSEETTRQGNGNMVYLIFDNMELIRDWDKNSTIIPMLFRLYDQLKMPELGLIFVSSCTPDTYYANTGFVEPLYVRFTDYTEDELHQIFMKNKANTKLYSSFLDVVLKPFCRITRRVDELSTALRPLFQKYCEPLCDMSMVPDENTKRRLFSHLQPHLAPALNQIFKVSSLSAANKEKVRKESNCRNYDREASEELDFHMPVSAKYLLISSFLASRNPATLDAALFDSTGGSGSWKRKRKISEKSIQKKDEAAQEQLMKGPGTFPLERLLAMYQCITSVAEDLPETEQLIEPTGADDGVTGLMADVLLQLSTLCNANFISKSGSCPLEGSTRYRSLVNEEMAIKVARSVSFPLWKYMYRR